jgi:hypothetical protein
MQTSHYKTISINLLLILAISLSIWQSSRWIYEVRQDQRTAVQEKNLLSGNSGYRWDFNQKNELHGAYSEKEFIWENGQLSGNIEAAAGRVSNSDFWLNLNGRYIDTMYIQMLKLRLFSESDNEIYFFHQQIDDDALHVSERIKINKGWQVLSLSINKINWTREDGFEKRYPFTPSSWGGSNQVATLFGMSPSKSGFFKVDWVELVSSFPQGTEAEALIKLSQIGKSNLNLALLERDKIWIIQNDMPWQSPEAAYASHLDLLKINPNVLIYLSTQQEGSIFLENQVDQIIETYFPILLGLLLLGSILTMTRIISARTRNFAELIILCSGMALLAWYSASIPENWLYLILLLLCVLLVWFKPQNVNYHSLGTQQSWISMALFTLGPIIFLIVLNTSSNLNLDVFLKGLGFYIAWATIQQFIFLAFIFPRLDQNLPLFSIVLCAGVFAYVHFPNLPLMTATFLMGIFWFSHYRKYKNGYAIVLSHALLGLMFREMAPHSIRLSGEVGLAYLSKLQL